MEREDIIRMSSEELRRVSILDQAITGVITQKKAAAALEASERQVRRLIRRIRQEGHKGLIHKSRGKPSNRGMAQEVRARVMRLHKHKYWDFGPTFACEKLTEDDGIELHPDTLRRWLVTEGQWAWQRRNRPHRQRRERKEYFGEMVQVDGSHHDWLEDRGPELVFMGYIDDATSKVYARFYDYEGTMPALESFKRYSRKYGLPQSIYLDKHTTYRSPAKPTLEEQLQGEKAMSQFERAMKELGVVVIHANSPQAKGRIERAFRTFQDRLIKEMRLAGIKTREEANEFLREYLPKHNRKFSIAPAKKGNLHRKTLPWEELRRILCLKTKRQVGNDGVIQYNSKFYQLDGLLSRRVKAVMVEEWLDGSMHVRNNGSYLKWREVAKNTIRRPDNHQKASQRPRKVTIPAKDHPWRSFKINPYKRTGNRRPLQPQE